MNLTRSHRKKILILFIFSAFICSVAYALVYPWRLDFWNDVPLYYKHQRFIQDPGTSLAHVTAAPFYNNSEKVEIKAPESKPVYMACLNIWGSVVRFIDKSQEKWPNRSEFFNFSFLNYWFLFIAIAILGWRLGGFWLGILGATLALLCPWSLIFLYYPSYVQFSMVLFFISILLALRMKFFYAFIAGIFSALAGLSNIVVIVYAFGLVLVIIISNIRKFQKGLVLCVLFFAGFLSVFLFFEIFKFTGIPQKIVGVKQVDTPLVTLIKYYKWSVSGANEFNIRRASLKEVLERGNPLQISDEDYHRTIPDKSPKYPGAIFIFINHQSRVLFILCFLTPLFAACQLLQRRNTSDPFLRNAAVLLLPAVFAYLFMDVHSTVQLGRAYFVGYPLLILGGLNIWKFLSQADRRFRRAALFILAFYIMEISIGLADERQAFHAFNNKISKLERNTIFYQIKWDSLASAIPNLMTEEERSRLFVVNNLEELIPIAIQFGDITFFKSPQIESVLSNSTPIKIPDIEAPYIMYSGSEIEIHLGEPIKIPFYGVYPLLIFEDEFDTWRYLTQKEFNRHDFKNGSGVITMYQIKRVVRDKFGRFPPPGE